MLALRELPPPPRRPLITSATLLREMPYARSIKAVAADEAITLLPIHITSLDIAGYHYAITTDSYATSYAIAVTYAILLLRYYDYDIVDIG